MEAVAHSRSFAKKVGVPQNIGKEFTAADKGNNLMAKKANYERLYKTPRKPK